MVDYNFEYSYVRKAGSHVTFRRVFVCVTL